MISLWKLPQSPTDCGVALACVSIVSCGVLLKPLASFAQRGGAPTLFLNFVAGKLQLSISVRNCDVSRLLELM